MNAWIDSFLEMMRAERGAGLLTIQSYAKDLDQAEKLVKKSLQTWMPEDMDTYQEEMDSFSARSMQRKMTTLRQFFKFLLSEKVITQSPIEGRRSPRQGRSLPHFLTQTDMKTLLQPVDDASAQSVRTDAMLALIYSAGLRVSELVALRLQDLLEDKIFVHGKGGKERWVPYPPETRSKVQDYLNFRPLFLPSRKKDSPYLFPSHGASGRLTRDGFCKMVKKRARELGLEGAISPHTLRHSLASHLLAGGMNLRHLQTLLGHSDISTTQIYTHLQNDQLTSAVARHPLSEIKK